MIVAAAGGLIRHNTRRCEKTPTTDNPTGALTTTTAPSQSGVMGDPRDSKPKCAAGKTASMPFIGNLSPQKGSEQFECI